MNVEDPPGGTESGNDSPEKLKPVPPSKAWVTLRFAVPGLLIVSVWVLVTPTATLLKFTLVGITLICGCMPLPLSEIVAGELVALLTTLRLPVALTAVPGAKLTMSAKLWPAARVMAPVKPLTPNPPPVVVTCEMLTLPVPVFVSETDWEAEVPTKAFPKLRLLGLAESKFVCEGKGDVGVPVPETETVWAPPPLRVVLRTILPLKVTAASGWNMTWKDALAWGLSVMGNAGTITTN